MDRTGLEKKARKRILLTAIISLILILTDLAVSSAKSGIDLVQTDKGLYMVRPDSGGEEGRGSFLVTIRGDKDVFEKKVSVALDPYGTKKKEGSDASKEEEELADE